MPSVQVLPPFPFEEQSAVSPSPSAVPSSASRRLPRRVSVIEFQNYDPLMTAEDVARRLNVSKDWVWDHSSRKTPRLPAIRMGDGALRYRASQIEAFITERERLSSHRFGRR